MSLCLQCIACPEVEIADDEVKIGEAGNRAVLKKDEWNVLVARRSEERTQNGLEHEPGAARRAHR
jgi:hypothetical protein